MRQDIDKDDFDQWLDHPITKRYREFLENEIQDIDKMWKGLLDMPPHNLERLHLQLNERKSVLSDMLKINEENLNYDEDREQQRDNTA